MTIIVLVNRNKSLKRKGAVSSQFFIFTSLEIYSGRDGSVKKSRAREEYYLQQVLQK